MGNLNTDTPQASSSAPGIPSSSKPAKPTPSNETSGPSNPKSPLVDLDPTSSHPPDEALPSYEDSTAPFPPTIPGPSSSNPTIPPTDPPPFSIYQPTTHPHYLNSHLITHDPHLNTSPEALYQFLLQENLIPPILHVQIRGTHQVTNIIWERDNEGRSRTKEDRRMVEDFNFRIDLTGGLWGVVGGDGNGRVREGEGGVLKVRGDGERCYRGGRWKTKWTPKKDRKRCYRRREGRETNTPGAEDTGHLLSPEIDDPELVLSSNTTDIPDSRLPIRTWCTLYCGLRTTLKEFIVRKPIVNLDTQLLTTLLTSTIRQTNYRGQIIITFPKQKHKIAIYPDTRFARLRNNPWVRWFFYLTFLWVISWPILYFSTRKFHVVISEWAWGWKWERKITRDPVTREEREEWIMIKGECEREWVSWWAGAVRCAARGGRVDDGCLAEWDRDEAERVERARMYGGHQECMGLAGVVGGVMGGLLGGRGWGGNRGWGHGDGPGHGGNTNIGVGIGSPRGSGISLRIGGGEGWGGDEYW